MLSARPTTAETGGQDYARTIKRLWEALGNPSYEELAGRDIVDLVASLRAQLDASRTAHGELTATLLGMQDGSLLRDTAAENERLRAQVAELTAERDKAREATETVRELREYDKATIAAHAKRIAELEAGLAPFGDVDGEGDEDFPDDEKVVANFGRTTFYALRLGDFRRARALLSATEEETK